MRILVIGDMHFRVELPYGTAFQDGRRAEWAAVLRTIHDAAKKCDAVVLLGDSFNAKHNHSSVIHEFVSFLKDFGDKEIHIIIGNHSRYGEYTALDFLKRMQHGNWHVYTEPVSVKVAGIDAAMIPFMTPALLGTHTREDGVNKLLNTLPKGELAFIHHAFHGSNVRGTALDLADFFNEIVLPSEIFSQAYKYTFAGHIHEKQRIDANIIVAGSIFTHEAGEHEKSIWIYDSEAKDAITEIPLPIRGIYKIIWESNDDKEALPSNSIVKCYVTNRQTNLEDVKKYLGFYDASMIVEQYPSERIKTHFEGKLLDLSIDTLLHLFAEAKGLSYQDLKEGFDLIV